ncbi:MAG: hypothetical protein K8T25_21995, partial [Planctomycetia bacterium]|nr:hypothetical protein [Planctomycetia bacterium]
MSEHFDPYLKWLAIPPEEQPPNHYRLLGVPLFMADADVISHAADQRMAHLKSFQTGQQAAASQRLLTDISVARACLLDVGKKAQYDAELRRHVAAQKAAPAPAPKRMSARPAPLAPPSSVAVEEPDWPIADVDNPGAKKTSKRGGTFKPKRRQLNPAFIVLPVFAVVMGIGLFVFWSQRRETVAPAVGESQLPPGTAAVPQASVARMPPAPVKKLPPRPPVVENLPRTDAAMTQMPHPQADPKPSFPDSLPPTPPQVTVKDPPAKGGARAMVADDDFPTGDEPAKEKGMSDSSTTGQTKAAAPDEAARAKAL